MKKVMVVKIPMKDTKSRKNAMKLAVSAAGVISVELKAEENKIVIVGEGVDVTSLTKLMRKKIGFTEIVSITPAMEEPETNRDVDYPPYYGYPNQYGTPRFNSYPYGIPQIPWR